MVADCVCRAQVRTHVDPLTHCVLAYTPHGRFVHVPPPYPSSDWANDFGVPWWRDGSYVLGHLSAKTRLVNVVNTLTSQQHVIEVSRPVGRRGPGGPACLRAC